MNCCLASSVRIGFTLFAYPMNLRSSSASISGLMMLIAASTSWLGIPEEASSPAKCDWSMCFAMPVSVFSFGTSVNTKIRSKRERRVGCMLICSAIDSYGSNLPYRGFAAPSRAQRLLRFAIIPAFATLTVCCSIASCREDLSSDRILSISTAAIPWSASTSAPASRVHLPSPNSSFIAVAVNPADVELLPLAYMPLGASWTTYRSSCDLPMPGSPTRRMWISPRMCEPSGSFFGTPENSWSAIASLTPS